MNVTWLGIGYADELCRKSPLSMRDPSPQRQNSSSSSSVDKSIGFYKWSYVDDNHYAPRSIQYFVTYLLTKAESNDVTWRHSPSATMRMLIFALGSGYNLQLRFDFDSTAIRPRFDRATTIRRPTCTSRPGCCTAAQINTPCLRRSRPLIFATTSANVNQFS